MNTCNLYGEVLKRVIMTCLETLCLKRIGTSNQLDYDELPYTLKEKEDGVLP